MLKTAADFPHAGSFALLIDETLPTHLQRAELVRIQFVHAANPPASGMATIAFPLRDGASGTRRVHMADLIDGTPLDAAERKEHAELVVHLKGRERMTPRLRKLAERSEALRKRAIFSMLLESELARLRSLEAREQTSGGQRLPRDIAA